MNPMAYFLKGSVPTRTSCQAFRPLKRQVRSRSVTNGSNVHSTGDEVNKANTRAQRIISRLPRFLQGYATPLYNAPVTHVTSFLILHEITAIVPLFGLAGAFHYFNWLPPYFSEGKWVHNGMEKFGNYFRKKGWLGEEGRGRWKWWGRGEGGVRIVVEFATAYAVTKALLPLRLILSVSATPWFARSTVVPVGRWFKRVILPGSKKTAAPPTKTSKADVNALDRRLNAKLPDPKKASKIDDQPKVR